MPDEPEDKKDRDFDAMFADYGKRISGKLTPRFDAMESRMENMVTTETLTAALAPIMTALSGVSAPPAPVAPAVAPAPTKTPEATPEPVNEQHVTSTDVMLKTMQAKLDSFEAETKSLKDDIAAKEVASRSDADTRAIEAVFSQFGVPNKLTSQATTLFQNAHPVIHDEKQGRVHEMPGEFGVEFKSTESAAETWLTNGNRHFLTPKTGSNAGADGGSLELGNRAVDMKALIANPDEYIANQEEYRAKLEGRAP